MRIPRRTFLKAAGVAGVALAARRTFGPLIRTSHAGSTGLAAKRVVIVAIGGGLRLSESLGMADGATMPNLFGSVPLVSGFGPGAVGPVAFAPEFVAGTPAIIRPATATTPLHTQGTLVTNLRYAEGPPGHLQGHCTLVSGAYNQMENRGDARVPTPTLFEIVRRERGTAATDAWYLSAVGGFYRALQTSADPDFGPRFAGTFLSPAGPMSAIVPLVSSGVRRYRFDGMSLGLPTIQDTPAEAAAVRRLGSILDGNTPEYADGEVRSSPDDRAAIREHLGGLYADPTYESFYPDSVGIGLTADDGGIDSTNDALTVYHAEQILTRFKPSVMVVTLLDIDACHLDYNGYLRGQLLADACVRRLWETIQSTDGLRNETALLVVPEHGRHLYHNGRYPDSLGRSGIDHGEGDDGDRNVWLLALGPDFRAGQVIAPTAIAQSGRTSGRYESVDVAMTAASILGHGDVLAAKLTALGKRPGLTMQELFR
ncbi:MAG: hypothetical protein EXR73_06510 [Myxococcales bacterium]|nr:hypothetical protein [Myxococcales bacterium]